MSKELPAALAEATADQPRARIALTAALGLGPAGPGAGPAHAYLFRGPRGSGKRAAARAFAAELLADGASDPEDARRRALLVPSPHPDLLWLAPPGAQHLVDEVRERVIKAASYRPFEANRRVFVIEAADAMGDESQNALLKTLEEPADFVHFALLSSEPALLAPTIVSRCQPVAFEPLAPDAVESRLAEIEAEPETRRAIGRLSGGDLERARFLLSGPGRALRSQAQACARSALVPSAVSGESPWKALLEGAEAVGADARQAAEADAERRAEGYPEGRERRRMLKEGEEAAKRAARRSRSEALDLALELCGDWYRDLAATASDAESAALNADRAEALAADAEGVDPARARAAVELVLDTRRRLRINVSEELALDALSHRLHEALSA